jgi:hypothetical protein
MAREKMTVNAANYLVIQGWMVTKLGLKGNELLIYALIYGFSQTRDQWFTGTHQYLADWTNSTIRSVINNINELIEKEYIVRGEREYRGQMCPTYKAVVHEGMKKPDERDEKSSPEGVKNFHGGDEKISQGGEKISPDNIDNNNIYNTPFTHNLTTFDYECSPQGENPPTTPVEGEKKSGKGKGKKKSEFIPPTLGEVIAYCASRGNKVDPQKFYDYYDASGWVDGKGNPVRNWKQKCITWERNDDRDAPTVNVRVTQTANAQVPVPPALSESDLDELFGFEMPGKGRMKDAD